MLKILTKISKKISLPLVVIYIAFLSYNYNFFHVVNDKWFFTHGQPTKRLIVDGLLRGKDEYGRLSLGKYSRPDLKDEKLLLHKLYDDKNKSGKFETYDAQYGLQLHFFHYLEKFGYKNINIFQGITALFMSAMVGALFYLLRRDFSITIASIFSATLIFSPWVVVFARHIYWMEATWFLPMIISMYFGKSNFSSKLSNIKFFVFLVLAYLLKMLCGYEYLTTVCIASCVPFVLYWSLEKYDLKMCMMKFLVNILSTFVAFFLAISIHVQLLSKDNSSVFENINKIYINAKARTHTNNPSIIRDRCEINYINKNKLFKNLEECEKFISKNLSKNSIKVAARYFIFPDFLPWIGHYYSGINEKTINSKDYNAMKTLYNNLNIENIKIVIFETDIETKKAIVVLILNTLLFLTLILLVFLRSNLKMRLMLMFSFIAPLSWFILAKGHSAGHYHYNYVLWYLPFIPFSLIALFYNNNEKKV